MVKEGELDISPDYQRLFQWSEGARSRFIESLLLEMPVPPIYVVEEDDGRKLLIDGLQRLSSYLHFRGMLEAEHLRPTPVAIGDKLVLQDCDILLGLNGKTYDDLGVALVLHHDGEQRPVRQHLRLGHGQRRAGPRRITRRVVTPCRAQADGSTQEPLHRPSVKDTGAAAK